MLSTNLLPAEEKQTVHLEEMRRTIVFLTGLAVLVFAAGFIFLAPPFLAVRLAERELIRLLAVEDEAVSHEEVRGTIVAARIMREAIAEARALAAEAPRSSAILERLLTSGEGIRVTSLIIRKDGTMGLSGHAATRAELLDFEERLRASDRFHEITFPLSNIVRERDIEFSMQGKLKPEYRL